MLCDEGGDGVEDGFAVGVIVRCDLVDAVGHDGHVLHGEAARGAGRGADAHAARDAGLLRVVRYGVLVDGDVASSSLICRSLPVMFFFRRSASIR